MEEGQPKWKQTILILSLCTTKLREKQDRKKKKKKEEGMKANLGLMKDSASENILLDHCGRNCEQRGPHQSMSQTPRPI